MARYVEEDNTKCIVQIKDLNELKDNVKQLLTDVKNGEECADRNLQCFGKRRRYEEIKSASSGEDRALQDLAASNLQIMEQSRSDKDYLRYEYEDMYYEGRNHEFVQRNHKPSHLILILYCV